MTHRTGRTPEWADTPDEADYWLDTLADAAEQTETDRHEADGHPTPTTCHPGCDCWGCAWTRSTQ